MKKLVFFLLLIWTFTQASAGNFIYPIDQISVPKCRFSNWSTLWSDCKMTLPRIVNWDYTKYKNDTNIRRIYSILRWATYNYGWDVWYGSHLWVDIATSAGTPIRSIWDWEVIVAWQLSGRWNTVVIKHKLSDGKYIYSNYAHMSKITTTKWSIKAWESIWEVGATGNAYGNHLHFQIDITNQSHPYWYTTCSKWIDIMQVVNDWMCRDFVTSNTIDPILFLESNWTYTNVTVNSIQQKQAETKKIEQKNIKSREQILQEEIADFLKTHSFDLKTKVLWDNLKTKTTYVTKLFAYNGWREFTWNMPWTWLYFAYDSNVLNINPTSIILAEKWWRDIQITAKKSWKHRIDLKLWNNVVYTKYINFYANWELSSPTDASIITNTKQNIVLWDEKLWAVIMKTNFWSNQIYIPYNGTYKIKALSWKVKFCNVSKKSIKKCNPIDLVSELTFNYEDTKAWILIFWFKVFDYAPIKFALEKIWTKYDISRTKSDILVSNPNRLDPSYVYYNENIAALKKGYFRLSEWYLMQDREITWSQIKDLINNYYAYEFLRSWDNLIKKNVVLNNLRNSQNILKSINDNEKLTRWKMTKIIFDCLKIDKLNNSTTKFIDEKWEYKNDITTLRIIYWFKWKDQFWENYFQPDKAITIWESLYLIERLVS